MIAYWLLSCCVCCHKTDLIIMDWKVHPILLYGLVLVL